MELEVVLKEFLLGESAEFAELCEFFSTLDGKMSNLLPVGPLAAAIKVGAAKARFFFDLPETVPFLACEESDGTLADHLCLLRDSPGDVPVCIVRNDGQSCVFSCVADSAFPAIILFGREKIRDARASRQFVDAVQQYCARKTIPTAVSFQNWLARQKMVVGVDLTTLGVVVPGDVRTVGYRELPHGDEDFLKACRRRREGCADDDGDLEGMVTHATIAADEGDFGTCLHLGRNFHCAEIQGERRRFRKLSHRLMKVAYRCLGRKAFCKVLDMHVGTN
eukprot:Polyplicarium_translucidae@DN2931_c0_g1_i1.p1